jgi:hypothetical protein
VTPAAEFAREAKDGLPVTESHGKITKIKRRTQGLYWARNGERSGGERDRRRGAAVAVVLHCGGSVEREERKEGARGGEEMVLILYRAEGEREEARKAVRGEVGGAGH